MKKTFEVTFLGTNGSCSFNNGQRKRYGTNTLCTAIRAGETVMIFDAGSGICGFKYLEDYQGNKLHLFLSHYHIDHISGLLFWKDLFDAKKEINIYGFDNLKENIELYLRVPINPVGINVFNAKLNFNNVKDGDTFTVEDNVKIKCKLLDHPGGSMGYRAEYDKKVVCYMTDVELKHHKNDDNLVKFAKNVGLLIIDSAYADGKAIPGWGHSTPTECANLAKSANVKKLALYHYGFSDTDEEIDLLEKSAKETFENTIASADRLCIKL